MLHPRQTPQHDEPEQERPAHSDGSDGRKDWRDLAEAASHEKDPRKLMNLVSELCEAIDHKPKPVARVENPGDTADNPAENGASKGKNGTDSK